MSNDLDEMLNQGPTLTFEPFSQPEAPEVPTVSEATQKVPEVVLTPEEQKMVNDFASQIDITNTQMVLQYGAGSQKKIADFSESALSNVRTKDMGEIGQMLAGVVSENVTVDVVEDLTLGRNECMIETEGGIFDCGLDTQLSELRKRLMLLSWSDCEKNG